MRWNPPKGCPALKIFLIQLEGDIFSVLPGNSSFYNLTKDEWLATRGLADDMQMWYTNGKGFRIFDHHLKPLMQSAMSYVKDASDF